MGGGRKPVSSEHVGRRLGEISYPLFVIHGPTIIGLQFAMNAWHITPTFAIDLAILLAASFAAAMLLLKFVERPVMAWRRRIRLPSGHARMSSRFMPATFT
jgi:peptidoglycan/LPS O-acetylase OafA/YrhL